MDYYRKNPARIPEPSEKDQTTMKKLKEKLAFNKEWCMQASCRWASDDISKSDRTKALTFYDVGSA